MGRCVLPGLGVGVVAGLCCFPKKILIFFFRLQPKKNFSKKKIFQKKIFPRRENFFFGGVCSPPTILPRQFSFFWASKWVIFASLPPPHPALGAPDGPPRVLGQLRTHLPEMCVLFSSPGRYFPKKYTRFSTTPRRKSVRPGRGVPVPASPLQGVVVVK